MRLSSSQTLRCTTSMISEELKRFAISNNEIFGGKYSLQVHITKCDNGCFIFAATQGEGFVVRFIEIPYDSS